MCVSLPRRPCAPKASFCPVSCCVGPSSHKFFYAFKVVDDDVAGCPLAEIALNVTDLQASLAYWSGFLKFKQLGGTDAEASLVSGDGQCALRLVQLPAGQAMDHGTG